MGISALQEGMVANTSKELVFIPDNLGACKAVGAADFGDGGGAPCCVYGVSVLPACNFWCNGGFLPKPR